MKIVWSPLALERVVEIATWFADDRPDAAVALVDELFAAVKRLSRFPESGRRVPELHQPDVREIMHDRYRIIYRMRAEQVEVLTVRHSRQDLDMEHLEP